jgi:hypothetical protein
MVKLKNKIKKIILSSTSPILVYFAILLLSSRNIYIEKKYIGFSLLIKLYGLKGFGKFNVTSTGALVLFYLDRVLKIPLSNSSATSLDRDINFYNEIKSTNFGVFFRYTFSREGNIYKMDLLYEGKDLHQSFIQNLTRIDNEHGNLFKKNLRIEDLLHLVPNYRVIESRCGFNFDLKRNIEATVGFMHGDLTQNNILLNGEGDICLIDLDRAKLNGIRELDEIHFIVDKNSKQMNISYFNYIEKNLEILIRRFEINQIYLYLMYRVSNEFRNGVILEKAYYNSVHRCHCFLTNFNVKTCTF